MWRLGVHGIPILVMSAGLAFAPVSAADHSILEVGSADSAGRPLGVISGHAASADGSRLIFSTLAAVASSDTDSALDLYMRQGSSTTLITGGTTQPSRYTASTPDAVHVVFSTTDSLTADDTDGGLDFYRRSGATTALVSIGPAGGNGPFDVEHLSTGARISDDGARIFFHTQESLVSEDTDGRMDLYERAGGTTRLLSTGPAGGNGPFDVNFRGPKLSADGSRVLFVTREPLVTADTDTFEDLYMSHGGATEQVSTGPQTPGCAPFECGIGRYELTPDGEHALFETNEPLVAADTHLSSSVYKRSGNATTLESVGPTGSARDAFFATFTPDGSHVLFSTGDRLTPDDTDDARDGYDHTAGTTTLVTTSDYRRCDAPAGYGEVACRAFPIAVSDDGETVIISTGESLATEDNDICPPEDPTEEPPLPCEDVYIRSNGVTRLASTGPMNANAGFDSLISQLSTDLSRIFFWTDAALTPDDADNGRDIYERHDGATTLISGGAGSGSPFDFDVSDDGKHLFFETSGALIGGDTNNQDDVYVARVAGPGHVRPKSAGHITVPLVPAYSSCAAPNRTHGPPLVADSCNPPLAASSRLTLGTPDANGKPVGAVGRVRAIVRPGNPNSPADEADVGLVAGITDVRRASDLDDYMGEVELRLMLRITDRLGGESATVVDSPISVAVPCSATADATGGRCAISTTVDAVVPGLIQETVRSNFEVAQVRVLDGGPDGVAATQDNDLFAVQGLLVP